MLIELSTRNPQHLLSLLRIRNVRITFAAEIRKCLSNDAVWIKFMIWQRRRRGVSSWRLIGGV